MNQSKQELKQGIIDSLPIVASFVLFGAIFGMLSLQAGLKSWEAMLMSLLVYAGAAQFTALSMIMEQSQVWSIVLAAFLLNSRHFLMGLSMAPHYAKFDRKFINTSAFFLVDEQYAITLNRFRNHPSHGSYILAVSISLYASWNLGTWLGVMAGSWIPDPAALGLGFSFTAMFMALAYYQLSSWFRAAVFILCGIVAVALATVLPNGLHLLFAGGVAFAIGYATAGKSDSKGVKAA